MSTSHRLPEQEQEREQETPYFTLREDRNRGTLYDSEGSAYAHLYRDSGCPRNRAEDWMIRLLDSVAQRDGERRLKPEDVGARSCLSWM